VREVRTDVILLDFNSMDGHSFNPGLLSQDVLTIPLEAGLIASMNHTYTPTPKPLVKFENEVVPEGRKASRHPKELLVPIGAAWALGTLGYLESQTDRFPVAPYLRGWIHSHLITEIATTFSKTAFQRPRPFYEKEVKKGSKIRKDDRLSFFSGHASHAFTFAGYSSSMMLSETNHSIGAWAYTGVAMLLAASVARARAIDGQHNWTDVIAGSFVGLTTSVFVQKRVSEVIHEYALRPSQCTDGQCDRQRISALLSPLNLKVEGKDIFGLSVSTQF
jgi:hypothetical protein